MKKLICVFSATLLFALSSCSTDEVTATSTESISKTTNVNSETSKLGLDVSLGIKIGQDGVVEIKLMDVMGDGTLVMVGVNKYGDVIFYPTPEQLVILEKLSAAGSRTCGCGHKESQIILYNSCCYAKPSATEPTCAYSGPFPHGSCVR